MAHKKTIKIRVPEQDYSGFEETVAFVENMFEDIDRNDVLVMALISGLSAVYKEATIELMMQASPQDLLNYSVALQSDEDNQQFYQEVMAEVNARKQAAVVENL